MPAEEQSRIRALVVDDEPIARAHVRSLLAGDAEVEVVGECGNGRDAVAAILSLEPDLVFLDIQMPELDGFGVVRGVGVQEMPVVVFITAYDEYALKAFEVHALDYLLKPVDRRRFQSTLQRAKAQVRRGAAPTPPRPAAPTPAPDPALAPVAARLAALLDELGVAAPAAQRPQPTDRIAIKSAGRIIFVRVDDIDWIETSGNHARLHVGKTAHLLRDTLSRLEERLPSSKFLRIHRSTIVNIDRIAQIQPWFQGDYLVMLADGTRLTSGRSYRERMRAFLERSM